jgi:hypothetical protein
MSLRQAIRILWLRSLGAAALLIFVSAQAICFAHCHLGSPNDNAEAVPSCHATVPKDSSGGGDDAPASMPSEACVTLKTMLTGADSPTLVVPEFHILDFLSPLVLSLEDLASQKTSSEFRQARPFDWVFTPAVSLGPAFRSLAPPFAV